MSSANLLSLTYDPNALKVTMMIAIVIQNNSYNVSLFVNESELQAVAVGAGRTAWTADDAATVATGYVGLQVKAPQGT